MTTSGSGDCQATDAPASQPFHLRQRGVLRVWLVSQVVAQGVFYAVFAAVTVQGYVTTGIVGLVIVFALATLRGYILLQPPLRVDPGARTIKARLGSWPQPLLSYDEAEAMELRARFGRQLHLYGPLKDRKGRVDPEGRYPLNLTGRSERADGGVHRLAPVLPRPLAALDDGVVLADRARWSDALRLAAFLNVAPIWRGEASCPDPLAGHHHGGEAADPAQETP